MRQTEHELKTLGFYWDAVASGEKAFEVRRNDRAFQTGDTVLLVKMDNEGRHYEAPPGRNFGKVTLRRRITYLLQGGQLGVDPGYCVLGLGPCDNQERDDA